jgi:hypothetical protein
MIELLQAASAKSWVWPTSMFEMSLKDWLTAAGIVLGGIWAIYRFGLTRARETALAIDLSYATSPYRGSSHLVCFGVTLSNTGGVKITAQPARSPAFKGDFEELAFAASVLVRRVSSELDPTTVVKWFPTVTSRSPEPGDIELDLLDHYESEGETSFWMEPREVYHLSAVAVLEPGTYFALITFVGENIDNDFWRGLHVVEVPKPSVSHPA